MSSRFLYSTIILYWVVEFTYIGCLVSQLFVILVMILDTVFTTVRKKQASSSRDWLPTEHRLGDQDSKATRSLCGLSPRWPLCTELSFSVTSKPGLGPLILVLFSLLVSCLLFYTASSQEYVSPSGWCLVCGYSLFSGPPAAVF